MSNPGGERADSLGETATPPPRRKQLPPQTARPHARTDTRSVTCQQQFFYIYNPWNKEVVQRRLDASACQEESESGGIIWEALLFPTRLRLATRTLEMC